MLSHSVTSSQYAAFALTFPPKKLIFARFVKWFFKSP